MEIRQHRAHDMPQPTGDPMTFDGRAHRLRNDQTHLRSAAIIPPDMDDEIGLHHPHPVFHRRTKLV